jgi:hypothetical protein
MFGLKAVIVIKLYLNVKKGANMSYKVGVVIEKDEYCYYASCPELEGCQSQGETFEQALENFHLNIFAYFIFTIIL